MKKMETNDWIMLNNIIYKIYTTECFNDMRYEVLDQLKMLLDFDSADFYMASREEGKLLCNPVTYNCDVDLSEMYEDLDYSRGIVASGKMLIYRETDIISDEARMQTDYYKKVYKPNNWHYALQIVIARHKKFLGAITFYRTIGKENFHYDDIFVLDMLKDHLSYRLYRDRQLRLYEPHKYTIVEATREFGLTGREEMVLQCIMEGKDKEEICEELSISINTFKKHSLNIYRKLQVNNRVQLFKKVLERE